MWQARSHAATDRKSANMRAQVDQSPHLLMWIASVAVTLLCTAGIAAFMAWMPTAVGNPKDNAALAASSPIPTHPASATGDAASAGVVSDTPTGVTCAECGVIESVREIDAHGERPAESTRSYEFTIRFQDGSRRVFTEATPRNWRSGTRVKVID